MPSFLPCPDLSARYTLTLFLPACTKDDPAPRSGTDTSTSVTAGDQAFKYRTCLRENGLKVDEPKPGDDPRGIAIKEHVSPDKVEKAQKASQQAGDGAPASDPQQRKDEALKYAKCMRENGYDMPDPSEAGDQEKAQAIDPAKMADFEKANVACSSEN